MYAEVVSEKAKTRTVSDLLVESLKAEGVKYIFGLPGEENEDMLFSLKDSGITFVNCRHEQEAAFMADVWGRLTGTAGVCLATLGPGATNLVTGVADAHLDKAPVVAITGQGSMARLHKESHQLIDVVKLFEPITKWNTSIHSPDIVTEATRKAFKLAQMEKPGATHLELPEDMARTPSNAEVIPPTVLRRPAPDYKTIDRTMALLEQAKKPIIIAGNGAIRKLASKHLRQFVEHTDIPVVSTFMGKGAVSDKDPHSLHTIGVKGRDFPLCAIERADLILTVGYDIAEYDPVAWNTSGTPIVHIDFEPAEVYEKYQPAVEIVCDISAALWELNNRVSKSGLKFDAEWYRPVKEAIEHDQATYDLKPGDDLTVPGVLRVLRQQLGDDDIVISDVGAHKMWIGRNFPVYAPGSCLISNSFASMGIAVPGGLAARLAKPEQKVVSVTGDGGFLMNSQAIETAARLKTPYVILIVSDNHYGLIKWKQERSKGDSVHTALENPDFLEYAKSFGVPAYAPKDVTELERDLAEALTNDTVSVVAVDVNPKVNLELSQKLDTDLCAAFSLPK